MAGKSHIGRELSKIMGYSFVDTDDMIIKKEQREINDIFSACGEEYFRHIEKEVVKEASCYEKTVIATGGGVVLNPLNIENLRKNGVIVNLKITPDVIKKRIEKEKSKRPLIKDLDVLGVLEKLKSREEYYNNCDYSITVLEDKTPEEHARMIIDMIKEVI